MKPHIYIRDGLWWLVSPDAIIVAPTPAEAWRVWELGRMMDILALIGVFTLAIWAVKIARWLRWLFT